MWPKVQLSNLLFISALVILFLPENQSQFCTNQECRDLADLRFKKQLERQRDLLIIRLQNPITEKVMNITDLPFEELRMQLQKRQLNATEVLSAFVAKTIHATKSFNCISEFSKHAMAKAEKLDESPTIKGPLHGIPFCANDNHDIKGMDSTLGYAKNLYRPAKKSAAFVKALEDLGAIPFCKTNVPQTMISSGSDNPIFGTTSNPLNMEMTPGGSSGSACIVGAGAVKFASATDIGGCIRDSVHMTGISGIKTTEGRISPKGVVSPIPKMVGLAPSTGFMADDPAVLSFILRELLQDNRQMSYDSSSVLPVGWNSSLLDSTAPLRIGYIPSYALFPAMGDTTETVMKAKRALEARGHTLVPFEVIDSYGAYDTYTDLLFADGGVGIKEQLRNDQVSKSFQLFNFYLSMPTWKQHLLSFLPVSERLKIVLTSGVETRRSDKLWNKMNQKREIRESILKHMEKDSLDALLTPAFPFAAPLKEEAHLLFLGIAYSSIWNVVEFPAGVVKFGTESGTNITSYDDQGDPILKLAKSSVQASKGMPIGVQVVGKPFQDELVLRLMTELYKNK